MMTVLVENRWYAHLCFLHNILVWVVDINMFGEVECWSRNEKKLSLHYFFSPAAVELFYVTIK